MKKKILLLVLNWLRILPVESCDQELLGIETLHRIGGKIIILYL